MIESLNSRPLLGTEIFITYNHVLFRYMTVFVSTFVTGDISEKDIMEIEEKVCQKSGLNPLSVFRYSKLDFKRLKKN